VTAAHSGWLQVRWPWRFGAFLALVAALLSAFAEAWAVAIVFGVLMLVLLAMSSIAKRSG
jgi:hypothetical protein